MISKKIYLIQTIVILLILLTISVVILYNKVQPMDYQYEELIKVPDNYNPKEEYFDYNDFNYDEIQLDENGVCLVEVDEEMVYKPSFISCYGLYLYSKYIETEDIAYYHSAQKQADYLMNIQNKEDGGFYYEHESHVAGTKQNLEPHWISASSQGQAMSLLSRMYEESQEKKYKNACELAIKPFLKKVENNGVCASFLGYDFYEKYPTEVPNYSLSGFMYSLIGLYDVYDITNNLEAKKLYDTGIETLKICLPYYDYNEISLYNLAFMQNERLMKVYSADYHIKHIAQLEVLNQIENNEVFDYFIHKWKSYVIEK